MDRERIISTLEKDEGFAPVARWDVKQWSYGFGCRAPSEGAVITREQARTLLGKKVDEAIDNFLAIFLGHVNKFNDVRAEAFVNMIFNMGPGKKGHPEVGGMQSFVNTLGLIFKNDDVPWEKVADNLMQSKWFRQVRDSGDAPGRGNRIVAEVRTGERG